MVFSNPILSPFNLILSYLFSLKWQSCSSLLGCKDLQFQGTNAQTSLSVAKKSFIINMRPGCRTSSPPSRVQSGPRDRDLQPPWPQARHRLVRRSPVQIWRRYINQNDIQQCVLASHLYHH